MKKNLETNIEDKASTTWNPFAGRYKFVLLTLAIIALTPKTINYVARNYIERKQAQGSEYEIYTVQPKDALWKIYSKLNYSSVEDLIKDNPQIIEPNLIYVGDKLKYKTKK
jgi:LysM repeat protein